MTYAIAFAASDDADWAQAIELIDATTSQALADATDATYDLEVSYRGGAVLTASSDVGTITKPEDNILQWHFTKAQMKALAPGRTYKVGLNMTTPAGTIPLVIGSLALLDGGL